MFNLMKKVVRRLFDSSGNQSPTRKVHFPRLQVEVLGERIMPATEIWVGAAANNLASSAANWNTNTVPVFGDDLVFDGARSNKNAVIDAAFVHTVGSITLKGGYGGTITIDQFMAAWNVDQSSGKILIPAQMELDAQHYKLSGGSVSGPGLLSISVGTTSTMDISGGSFDDEIEVALNTTTTTTISAATQWTDAIITNAGTLKWTGGDITVNAGELDNFGVLIISSDNTIEGSVPGNVFALKNYKMIQKTAGVGTTKIDVLYSDIQPNAGQVPSVWINTGEFNLCREGEHRVAMNVGVNATIEFTDNQTFYSGSSFLGAGIVQISASVTIPFNNTLASSADLKMTSGTLEGFGTFTNSGLFEWSGGGIKDLQLFQNSGAMNILGGGPKTLVDTLLTNQQLVVWTGAGSIILDGAQIVNQGTFEVQNDASIDSVGVGVAFANLGTFRKTAGFGDTTVNTPFTNTGTFLLNGFAIDFAGGFLQNADNAVSRLGGGTVSVTGSFNINAGLLSGTGVIDGDLRLNANLDFGTTVGTLSVSGNYQQTATGKVKVKIAGNGAGNCDVLDVAGTTTLAGSVSVQLVNGYMPIPGTQSSRFLKSGGNRNGTLTAPLGMTVVADLTGLTLTF